MVIFKRVLVLLTIPLFIASVWAGAFVSQLSTCEDWYNWPLKFTIAFICTTLMIVAVATNVNTWCNCLDEKKDK